MPHITDPKPYHAPPDLLRPIGEADLPAYYRREAAWLRAAADRAEIVEMRITLLAMAERLESCDAAHNDKIAPIGKRPASLRYFRHARRRADGASCSR